MNSRRKFLKTTGAGILAAGLSPLYASSNRRNSENEKSTDAFKLGMAGYTFREFTVEKTIEMMYRIGVSFLSLKDFHLPMNSSQEQVDEVLAKFKNAGITVLYARCNLYEKQ